jgi:replicative DNA helicase
MSAPTTAELQQLLPHSEESESAFLSSLLISPRDVADLCAERGIKPTAFHRDGNATMFRRAIELIDAKGTVDFVTLTETLRDRGELEGIGGAAKVTEIFTMMPTAAMAGQYAEILEGKRVLREIIRLGRAYVAEAFGDPSAPAELLDRFEREVGAIRQRDEAELREADPKETVMEVLRQIEDYYEKRGKINGLETGYRALDKLLDGLHEEEMIVIAARPSMGKTALGMNIAEHIAYDLGKTVAVFTLEMSPKQLYQRVLLSRARLNMSNIRNGFLTDGDFPKISKVATSMAASQNLRVIDAIGASIGSVRARARRLKRRYPDLACIVVDYMQKMRSTSKQALGSREREISEISGGLKDMAKELRLPVVAMAQLNREAEKRTGASRGRPRMSDLRESGAIEQDADVIGLLYREEYYSETEEEKAESEGRAEIIIAKNRNGPVESVPLTFLKEFARFESRASEANEEPRRWDQD